MREIGLAIKWALMVFFILDVESELLPQYLYMGNIL